MTTRLTPERLRFRFSQRGDTETVPVAELRAVLAHTDELARMDLAKLIDAAYNDLIMKCAGLDDNVRNEALRNSVRHSLDISVLSDDLQRLRLRLETLEERERKSLRGRIRHWLEQFRTMFAPWDDFDHDFIVTDEDVSPVDLRNTMPPDDQEAAMIADEQISLLEALGVPGAVDANCITQSDGDCVSELECMHTAKKQVVCTHCKKYSADGPHATCPHCGADWTLNMENAP